ncbi:MAG: hypothetical protein U0168_21595 [Nannocystaceae bacterium]
MLRLHQPLGPEPAGFVVGPMTVAQQAPARAGAYVGARLQPAAVAALLRTRPDALADGRVGLEAWWPDWPALVEAMARDGDAGGVARMLARLQRSLAAAPPLVIARSSHAGAAARPRCPTSPRWRAGRSRQHLTRRFREPASGSRPSPSFVSRDCSGW